MQPVRSFLLDFKKNQQKCLDTNKINSFTSKHETKVKSNAVHLKEINSTHHGRGWDVLTFPGKENEWNTGQGSHLKSFKLSSPAELSLQTFFSVSSWQTRRTVMALSASKTPNHVLIDAQTMQLFQAVGGRGRKQPDPAQCRVLGQIWEGRGEDVRSRSIAYTHCPSSTGTCLTQMQRSSVSNVGWHALLLCQIELMWLPYLLFRCQSAEST